MHRAPPQRDDRRGCPLGLILVGLALMVAVVSLLVSAFLVYGR